METPLGVAVGSQRVALGPDCEVPAAPRPLLHTVTGSSSLPRGVDPVLPSKRAQRGGPPPAAAREAQPWGTLGGSFTFC